MDNQRKTGLIRDIADALACTHGRDWHAREQNRSEIHPAVIAACHIAMPTDLHTVVVEWPHKSASDNKRLAYTQNERKGAADIQTITTVGKYLTKHFPSIPDHVIRGLVSRFNAEGCAVHTTQEWIIKAVQEGPGSCMQWHQSDINRRGGHPYQAYDPKYGWGVAVRISSDGEIVGRALVLEHEGHKHFVRTYMKPNPGGYSERDEELEQWLITEAGYCHESSWSHGAQLAKILCNEGYLLPYIDGCTQNVTDIGNHFEVCDGGEYECTNTNGLADSKPEYTCDDCEEGMSEDDRQYLGDHLDSSVCGDCCSRNYTWVTGRRRNEYYVSDEDVVTVDGEAYHNEYLGDNDIVELDNGAYCKADDAFCCEVSECWYHVDDGRFVEDKGGMVHEEATWQCETSDKWYSTDTEWITDDAGDRHHPYHYVIEETEEESTSIF